LRPRAMARMPRSAALLSGMLSAAPLDRLTTLALSW
jgi:hypothetical protein